ncbi:lipid II flippase Amj family protein [Aneurinibacillus aneurinilyticus]|nr:lipid II flippase Amj family protein [Aneurinibacillus aneurinilyticus]MED0708716.1 lipid II flippase Amj family protein [Aneurinibacillus aneurinilyticus]MED0724324.1 lipid II flippase Amj family protein [Aneurinibacillus aneurinilyticus]MED0734392.1 lipid II flippase Amj family protein [Aneurinibacillus aneurinilyticus]MED0739512.1 lipid II flippase Amj family protein [Aneurinibacillus aneurinilyticus]
MFEKLLVICVFTLIIHMIDTFAYSVRIAGIRTGKIAIALSVFSIIVIVSRTSNMIQAPLTGSLVDMAKHTGDIAALESQFRVILLSSSLGTVLAALLLPTFVSMMSRAIVHLEMAGSVPQLVKNVSTVHHLKIARKHFKLPRRESLSRLRIGGVPKRILLLNMLAAMIYADSVLACLYASLLKPEYSSIALTSTGLINGFSTIILTVFLDPQIAILTDKVMKGTEKKDSINKMVGVLTLSRFVGTVLAQLFLVPFAYYITWLSQLFA